MRQNVHAVDGWKKPGSSHESCVRCMPSSGDCACISTCAQPQQLQWHTCVSLHSRVLTFKIAYFLFNTVAYRWHDPPQLCCV
jgi:hypothetical protein